jgi:hypothetical protein
MDTLLWLIRGGGKGGSHPLHLYHPFLCLSLPLIYSPFPSSCFPFPLPYSPLRFPPLLQGGALTIFWLYWVRLAGMSFSPFYYKPIFITFTINQGEWFWPILLYPRSAISFKSYFFAVLVHVSRIKSSQKKCSLSNKIKGSQFCILSY